MFIAFDGIDGIGKTTQVNLLTEKLRRQGNKVLQLDLGKTIYFSEIIKKINLHEMKVPPEVRELIYYFEGLYANINYIQTAKQDEIIIIDRYYLSYFAYGIANGMIDEQIAFYTRNLIEPDLYFFLDTDVRTTGSRIHNYRNFDIPELGYQHDTKGLTEECISKRFFEFQNEVRMNYLSHLKPYHIIIDASGSIEDVSRRIWNVVATMV